MMVICMLLADLFEQLFFATLRELWNFPESKVFFIIMTGREFLLGEVIKVQVWQENAI